LNVKTLLIAAVGLVAAVPAWLPATPAIAATQDVAVQDNEFVDSTSGTSTTTITAGDTVVWTWSGSNPHTVDSTGGGESFSSGSFRTSGTFSYTFNTPGTFTYLCGVHGASMQGTIVVNAGAAPTGTPAPQSTSTAPPASTNTPEPEETGTSAGATSTRPTARATPARTTAAATAISTPSAGGSAGGSEALPPAGAGPDRGTGTPWLPVALAGAGVAVAVALGGLAWVRRRA
jgi:plastocyanin